jgi:hypothetical protein
LWFQIFFLNLQANSRIIHLKQNIMIKTLRFLFFSMLMLMCGNVMAQDVIVGTCADVIAGVDGTLEKRIRATHAEGNVRAKTGTVTGVSALAGYLNAPNNHFICFSIINMGIRQAATGRNFQDQVCAALCRP